MFSSVQQIVINYKISVRMKVRDEHARSTPGQGQKMTGSESFTGGDWSMTSTGQPFINKLEATIL